MTTPSSPPQTCQFCNKKGLPILPLRYAVARKDLGNAPALSAPFGAGVNSIALPAELAHYTSRLLRPGYLYVYDQHRKEWTAYQVAPGGYLFQFDPHAKAPPRGWGQANFACTRAGDAMIARCITVKDAAQATTIWLGFSDVAWTPSVLSKHDSAAYRQAHMRSIDVATLRSGGKQPHAAGFAELGQRVAEYATTPAALNAETASYVSKYLPPPYKRPSDLLNNTPEAQSALKMCSKLIVGLLPQTMPGPPPPQARVPSAAWAFSAADLDADSAGLAAMQAWATTAAKPYHGGIVALDDPAGIAMEINGLALQLSAEFSEEPKRKWKHETALTIAAIKEAVMHGAVKKEAGWRKFWTDGLLRVGESGGGFGIPASSEQVDQTEQAVSDENARIDKEVEEQADIIGEAEWKKSYATLFNEPAQLDELSSSGSYATALKQFAEQHIQPLDKSFLGWLQSHGFITYFTHNFDTKDIDSGMSYTAVLGTLFSESGGREAVVKYLTDALQCNPTDPHALIARGFALNQDALASKWADAAAEKAGESSAGKTLAEISEKVYDGYKGLMLAGNEGAAFNGLARYVYQLSAGVVNALGSEVTSVTATIAAKLPTRMLYGLLGAVARAESPEMQLVDLRTSASARQASKMLSRALSTLLGGSGNQYISVAQHMLSDKPGSFRGVVLIDSEKALSLKSAKGGGTLSSMEIGQVVKPQVMEEAIDGMSAKLANGEVKGGVVGLILMAITCKFAYREYAQASGDAKLKQGINFFVASLSSLVGGSMEVAGKLVEETSFGAMKLSGQFKVFGLKYGSTTEWLTGAGKMLGAFGGLVMGVICIWDAKGESEEGHTGLAFAHLDLGLLSIASAFLIILGFAAAGFVIGLLVGLVLLAIAIFKQNKVQDWLENSGFFGDGKLKPFTNPVQQLRALSEIGKD